MTEFIYNDRDFNLLIYEVPNPEDDYVILEQMNSQALKMVHIINVDHRDIVFRKSKIIFTLGRGNHNDICIYDKSVGRNHAVIELLNGQFYIKDVKSATGTYFLNQVPAVFGHNFIQELEIALPEHVVKIQFLKSKTYNYLS